MILNILFAAVHLVQMIQKIIISIVIYLYTTFYSYNIIVQNLKNANYLFVPSKGSFSTNKFLSQNF